MRYSPILIFITALLFQNCEKDELSNLASNQIAFPEQLSHYNIYQGNPADLVPNSDYVLYQLSSALFTDHAEKQRLIKLPAGTVMEKIDNGLPSFPDGTIIVKTFYYYHDKTDISKGKRVIETRLLVKEAGAWNVADYLWNDNQTDATLIVDGYNTTVNYIDENGQPQVLAYHVPNNGECATCHSSNEAMTPIGPKLRNMNFDVETDMGTMNQLSYFQSLNRLGGFNHADVMAVPDYKDETLSLEERGRAYLDANCSHCHSEGGFAAGENLFFSYDIPFEETNIDDNTGEIANLIGSGEMPFLGTTVLDSKGISLVTEYMNSLP